LKVLLSLAIDFVITATAILPGLGIAYVANFQRTVLLVGKALVPAETLLVPEDLRVAITPRRLAVCNVLAWCLLGTLLVGCLIVGWYVLILPLLIFFGAGYSALVVAFSIVPKPGSDHYMEQIDRHLKLQLAASAAARDATRHDVLSGWERSVASLKGLKANADF